MFASAKSKSTCRRSIVRLSNYLARLCKSLEPLITILTIEDIGLNSNEIVLCGNSGTINHSFRNRKQLIPLHFDCINLLIINCDLLERLHNLVVQSAILYVSLLVKVP